MKSSLVMVVTVAMAMASPVQGACSADLSPYKPCIPAVVGMTRPLPTSYCCKVIKAVDLSCLCATIATADIPALNQEAALMLPKHCGVVLPDSSTCGKHANPLTRKLMDLH